MKIAWFTPFVKTSAIGKVSAQICEELSRHHAVEIWTPHREDLQETSVPVAEELGGTQSFEAQDMDGNTVSSDIFGESKITMVNVWATYCNPCLSEMPELGELAQEYDAGEFRLIGIISDVPENADEEIMGLAKDLIEQTGASYTHLPINQSLYDALLEDVTAVPTTFFFDENGSLLETVVGAREKSAWKEKIDELLENG